MFERKKERNAYQLKTPLSNLHMVQQVINSSSQLIKLQFHCIWFNPFDVNAFDDNHMR